MPYKSEHINIQHTDYDKRIKLSDEDKREIKRLSRELEYSQRRLADLFKVSRRTVQFILNPKQLEENKKRRQERGGWKQYYDKDSHAESMKEHRRYKQDLYINGEIK